MIILDCAQLSEQWFSERCGVPSASNFDKIVTTTGAPSKQAQKYLYTLAGERITQKKEETYQNAIMQRGIEMEAEARKMYELLEGVEVQQVGICFPDEKKLYACSPDGLVGDDGGLEIKCPIISTHVGYLLGGKLSQSYFQQIQGAMLITGRKWWSILSYYPGMNPFMEKVERDEVFIGKLETALREFCIELSKIVNKIK